jgi:hypothetical protein
MTAESQITLPEAKLLAGSNADLLGNKIDAGDLFSDRMLDLDAGVHLDEVELVVLVEEFEGARTTVIDPPTRFGTTLTDAHDVPGSDAGGRRLLDDLLVATLHRAIAFAEIDRIPEAVGQYLNLHVPRVLEVFLQIDVGVAEKTLRLRTGHVHRVDQCRFGMDDAHAASTPPPPGSLDDDRIAHGLGNQRDFPGILG